jgi:hypothetical protein
MDFADTPEHAAGLDGGALARGGEQKQPSLQDRPRRLDHLELRFPLPNICSTSGGAG